MSRDVSDGVVSRHFGRLTDFVYPGAQIAVEEFRWGHEGGNDPIGTCTDLLKSI
jgi:hypothetical protein